MTSSNSATVSLAEEFVALPATDARTKTEQNCRVVLENLYDSHNGYAESVEDCKEISLKTYFGTIAAIRYKFIDQLSSVLRSEFGFEPVISVSGIEATHHIWINIKAWFADGLDRATILAEIHRAEAHLIQHYVMALAEPKYLTNKVWQVLQGQLKTIQEQDAFLYTF